ncbi:hypothetical protein L3Q82_025500 [Scortum barcoo]|uniref:Uncharacterized protein n=1 Tax=Scortum barcoo TaxID=214431 RepID=A0ACB8WKI2_9TELE|nr:hypothetical protein L3Q82_025500 [Scortum barcoo]
MSLLPEFWSRGLGRRGRPFGRHATPPLLPKPHCTGPSWTFLRVVSLLEGGPTSPFRAEPGRVPWAKTRPPGARLRAPTPGLAPGWGPTSRNANPGDVTVLVGVLFMDTKWNCSAWVDMENRVVSWPIRNKKVSMVALELDPSFVRAPRETQRLTSISRVNAKKTSLTSFQSIGRRTHSRADSRQLTKRLTAQSLSTKYISPLYTINLVLLSGDFKRKNIKNNIKVFQSPVSTSVWRVHGNEDKMRVITRCCVLFLWMHTLTFVKSQDCTREAFLNGPLFDPNFDTTTLDARYPGGKQVRVGCNVGYSGFFKLICSEGKWISRGNVCQPISCGHPGDAQFADFHLEKGGDFVFGSQVVYTCHKGYQMVSRIKHRNCLAQGWDGVVPVCEAKQCPLIHVDNNVQVSGDHEEATFGNVVQFSCRSRNQILSGPSEIYCDEYGEWSGNPPTCKEITCTVPRIENGYVPGDIKVYRENEILQFECNNKYAPTEGRPSKCIKIGSGAEWSPTPICELIKCKLTPLEGTRYEPEYRNVFLPGDVLRVICGRKYWISTYQDTSVETTCGDNGEWTIRPVCQERRLRMQYTSTLTKQTYKYNEQAEYRCKDGYKGSPTRTCGRQGWTGTSGCTGEEVQNNKFSKVFCFFCIASCLFFQIDDANIEGKEKTLYGHNEEVHYTCNNDKRRLTANCWRGLWNVTHKCKGCPKLAVQNGFVVSINDRVYYSCNENYKLFTKGWWGEAKCIDQHWTGLERCIGNESLMPYCVFVMSMDKTGHSGLCTKRNIVEKFLRIPNGRVIQQTRRFYRQHESVQILCKEGYRAHLQQLTCHEGKWNSNELQLQNICTPSANSCNPPPRVANAVVLEPYQKRYAPNSEVTYQCRDTYTAEGEEKLRCKNGEWENSIKCIQYCDRFKEEKQAMTFTSDKDRYSPGEKIHYQCTTTDNNGTATCVNGQWNKSIECEEYCDQFKEKRQAMTFTSDKDRYSPGEKIRYQCTTINNNGIATCINGQWNKSIECEGSNCDPPPANGEITVNGLPENDDPILPDHIITFSCDSPGKHLSGSSVLKCGDDGRWNNTFPSCEDITCKLDKMDPHITVSITPSPEPIKIGHKLLFQCDNRYTLEGSKETACLETGQWSAPFPTCSEKCKVPGVPANVLIDRQVPNNLLGKGQSLKLRCRRYDHVIQGNAEVECLGNGQWSHTFPTCGQPCTVDKEVMSQRNIAFRYSRDDKLYSAHNDEIEFRCTGYRSRPVDGVAMRQRCLNGILNSLEHPLTSYCMHGKPLRSWKNARRPPSSLFNRIAFFTTLEFAACSTLPDVPHAHISEETRKADYREGDMIHFTCEPGYMSRLTIKYVCMSAGWLAIHQGKCYNITCKLEKMDPHITASITPSTLPIKIGHKLQFQCNRRYTLEGSVENECLETGQWSAPFPTCSAAVGCQKPPTLEGGDTRESTRPQYRHNERVEYVCQSFYTLEGDRYKTCINGEWTGQMRCLNNDLHFTMEVDAADFEVGALGVVFCEDFVEDCGCRQTGIAQFVPAQLLVKMHLSLILLLLQLWGNVEISSSQNVRPCELPENTPNGYFEIIRGEDFVFGTTIKYFCNEGYQMVSKDDTRTCLLDKWTNHVPICDPFSCDPPPADENITVKGLPQNEEPILPDRFLTFSCDSPGTYLNGSSMLICGKDGQWDNPFPSCEAPVGCQRPPPLEGGDTRESTRPQYRHNERVEYVCQSYYTLEGDHYKTCINGEWTGQTRCLKPCTVDKEVMSQRNIAFRYSRHDKLYSPHNDVIEFSCYRGQPVGTVSMRQKCVNGVMNLPACQ